MNQNDIKTIVEKNRGTTKTNHSEFEDNGYLILPNLLDVTNLVEIPPHGIKGSDRYSRKNGFIDRADQDRQVNFSYSRYNFKKYFNLHKKLEKKLSRLLNTKILTSYNFDRFYFASLDLPKHLDRDACEISLSLHISSTFPKEKPWPLKLEGHKGEASVIMNPGDAVLYKGTEIPHWRDRNTVENPNLYYHNVFFHFVLNDGLRAHCAFESYK